MGYMGRLCLKKDNRKVEKEEIKQQRKEGHCTSGCAKLEFKMHTHCFFIASLVFSLSLRHKCYGSNVNRCDG